MDISKLRITPGPWRVGCDLESINTDYEEDGQNWNKLNCTSNGLAKCITKIKRPKWMRPSESLNNASLISAAPEMLSDKIGKCLRIESYYKNKCTPNQLLDFIYQDNLILIEKACYPKKWDEIKLLLGEEL